MTQQYHRVNMAEVNRVLDAMEWGKTYTSKYLAEVTEMEWHRVTFALLRAEDMGVIAVSRPKIRAKKCNLYWRVPRV